MANERMLTPGTLRESLETGSLRPAYVVAGSDGPGIDGVLDRLLQEALQGEDPAAVLARFDGRDAEPAAVLDELRTLPLLGSRRVIVVDHADAFLERAGDRLKDALARPPASAVLILVARGVTAPASTFKALRGSAVIVGCVAPRRLVDRVKWLVSRAEDSGKRLSHADARLLLDLVGDNLGGLASELEKLATYVGGRKQIGRDDIEAIVGPTRVEPIYLLGDAITSRDLPRALELAEDLMTGGEALPRIVGMLRLHLRRFWSVKRCREAGKTPAQAAREIGEGNRVWLVEKLYGQVGQFTDADLARCFRELLNADLASKTGALPDAVALERFVVVACRGV